MKIVPLGIPFLLALKKGYLGRIEDRRYLDWVKAKPCCVCGALGCDPSHFNGHGLSGGATKSPDFLAIPLCRMHHEELHQSVDAFELKYCAQSYWAMLTLLQAIVEGFFDKEKNNAGVITTKPAIRRRKP